MKYRALYRETRPEVFDEILGQDSIVKILKHQVATNTVSHAYIFTGTRGTGKTTTARILAKAVNCDSPDIEGRPCGKCDACRQIAEGTFVDVIEIDAASNNGVDNIRELRESVNYPPAVGRMKVYIIDEVHMLSTGAFNALLKTLEEPPENVMFILATTNPEKLPQTVLSRCMRLDFKRVPQTILADHMREICLSRGVEIADDALRLLASNADGSVRDSLSILEQCLSSGEKVLTRDIVLDFLGAVSEEFYLELTKHVMSGDMSSAFVLIDKALAEGKDVKQIMRDWMAHFRNLLITKYVADPEDLLNLSSENIELLRAQSSGIKLEDINRAIITLAKAINDARYSTQARILLEVSVVSIASGMEYGEVPEVPARPIKATKAASVVEAPRTQKPVPAPTEVELQAQKSTPEPAEVEPQAQKSAPEPAEVEPQAQKSAPEPAVEMQAQNPAPAPDEVESQAQERVPEPAEVEPQAHKSASKPAEVVPEVLQDIWRDVCQEAAQNKPILSILSDCIPVAQKGDEIKLLINIPMMKEFVERDASYINGLLKKYGADGHIVCVLDRGDSAGVAEPGESDADKERLEAQKKVSEFLGIDVKLEQ